MEKDFFKDRTLSSTKFNAVTIGDIVYICEKHMQPTATKLEDLTKGMIIEKLTRADHPRGIKVRIIRETPKDGEDDEAIGRIVYILRNGKIVYGDNDIF